MITVTILTKNSEQTLAATLESVKKFPQVILFDTGSTDQTLLLAKAYPNVLVHQGPFTGFGPTHNLASSLATHDWILSIDSDEVLTPELTEEILHLDLAKDPLVTYTLNRHNYFNGKWIKGCGGWHPDRVARLYNRRTTQFSDDAVHEKILTQGLRTIPLTHPLKHYPYRQIGDFLLKNARTMLPFLPTNRPAKKGGSLLKAITHGWFAFFKSYILKKGFLAGKEGFIISAYNGHTAFYKYLKLMEKS